MAFVVSNFDDFKRNLALIESRLNTTDLSDPTKDIDLTKTWVEHVIRPNANALEMRHFVNEALPKIVRAVLKRKYANNDNHINSAKEFLMLVAGFAVTALASGCVEGHCYLLTELFDNKQPFYLKHGFPKIATAVAAAGTGNAAAVSAVSSNNIAVVNHTLISRLGVGDCFDYLCAPGEWTLAIVENFNASRTEMEILLMEKEKSMWIHLERDGHKIAEYGTMVSLFKEGAVGDAAAGTGSDTTATATATTSVVAPTLSASTSAITTIPGSMVVATDGTPVYWENDVIDLTGDSYSNQENIDPAARQLLLATTGTAGAAGGAPVVVEPEETGEDQEDVSWRFELAAGSLIDARDGSNVWYEACILEIKHVEVPPRSTATHQSYPTSAVVAAVTELPPVSDASVAVVSDVVTSDATGAVDESSQMSVETVLLESQQEDNLTASTTAPASVAMVAGPADDVRTTAASAATTTASADVEVAEQSAAAASVASVHLKAVARVTFLGWAERYDEWIDVDSSRIRKYNTVSHGKRGDLHIREDVLFVTPVRNTLNDFFPADGGVPVPTACVREGSLYSEFYAEIINIFGMSNNGFQQFLSCLETSPASVGLSLTIAMSYTTRVLTSQFLDAFAGRFVELSATKLRSMTTAELREIPTENIESALSAIESFVAACLGRNAQLGQIVEPLWVDVAQRLLLSPYLNRRLGGLKMLTDLIKRSQNALDTPSGFKSTKSTSTAGVESVSYRVVPILYFLNQHAIGKSVIDSGAVLTIFWGETSHSSLMERAGDVLKALAQEGLLDDSLLGAIWEAGFTKRQAQAMAALVESIRAMQADCVLTLLVNTVASVDPAAVTTSVVDVVAAMAMRARELLMTDLTLSSYHSQTLSSSLSQLQSTASESLSVGTGRSGEGGGSGGSGAIARLLHTQSLTKLWSWAEDGSGVSDIAAMRSLAKIEVVLAITGTSAQTNGNGYFSWGMHWLRCKDLIATCVESIASKRSILPAIKIIHSYLNSWPLKEDFLRGFPVFEELPFQYPTKAYLAKYLEDTYKLMDLVATAIVSLKTQFQKSALEITAEAAKAEIKPTKGSPSSPKNGVPVPSVEVQSVLNEVMVGSSRVGYKEQLDRALDFLFNFARFSDDLFISRECVDAIWRAVVAQAATVAEVELVVNFVLRLVLRAAPSTTIDSTATTSTPTAVAAASSDQGGGSQGSNASLNVTFAGVCNVDTMMDVDPTSTATAAAATATVTSSIPRRKALCTAEVVRFAFESLLCDNRPYDSITGTVGFIRSPYYTSPALDCTEKLFRWLNADAGLITDLKQRSPVFSIIGKPSSLIGVGVFSDIILFSSCDSVAAKAVTFLTSLPQKLAPQLVQAGELIILRKILLDQCVHDLIIARDSAPDDNSENTLKRLLMLLHGLLEESSGDIGGRIRPHGRRSRGNEITVKIAPSSKPMKEFGGPLTVYGNDTVDDLLKAIGNKLRRHHSTLKVFRLGKELTHVDVDKNQTLSQMKIVSDENFAVADRSPGAGNANKPIPGYRPARSADSSAGAAQESKSGEGAAFIGPVPKDHSYSDSDSGNGNGSSESKTGTANDDEATAVVSEKSSSDITVATPLSSSSSSLMPLDTLPAIVLSNNPDNFSLLFSLLEASHGPVCDDMWGLISKLPTSPLILKNWLHLDGASVSALLFDNDTVTLPRMLYNLQVIESLLQPAANLEEMQKQQQKEEGEEISADLLVAWPARFIAKGGLEAVTAAYDWLGTFMEAFLQKKSNSLASTYHTATNDHSAADDCSSLSHHRGASSDLVFRTAELIIRLTRSLFVRSTAVASRALPLLPILREVHRNPLFLDSEAPAAATSNSNCSDSAKGTQTQPSCSSSEKDITATATAAPMTEELFNLVDEEWGWRLIHEQQQQQDQQQFGSSSNILRAQLVAHLSSIDLVRIQATSLNLLSLLCRFMEDEVFSIEETGGGSTSQRNAVKDRQDTLFGILNGLLLVWASLIANQPSILLKIRSSSSSADNSNSNTVADDGTSSSSVVPGAVNITGFLRSSIFGVFDLSSSFTGSTVKRYYERSLSERIARWSAAAVFRIVELSAYGTSSSSNEPHRHIEETVHMVNSSLPPLPPPPSAAAVATPITDTTDSLSMPHLPPPPPPPPSVPGFPPDSLSSSLKSLSSSSSDGFSEKIFEEVRLNIFLALLSLRPPIISSNIPTTAATTAASPEVIGPTAAATVSLDAYFNLASSLLDGSTLSSKEDKSAGAAAYALALPSATRWKPLSIPLTDRLRICFQIRGELRLAHEAFASRAAFTSGPAKAPKLQYLGGTMKLLTTLAVGEPEVLRALQEDGDALTFILHHALGLKGSSSIYAPSGGVVRVGDVGNITISGSAPVLCDDEDSRNSAYSFVAAICASKPTLALEVFRALRPVHESVTTPLSWDYKPDRELRSSTGFVGLRNKGCTCYMNSLLQVLYMIPVVRESVLDTQIRPHINEMDAKNDILYQLRNLFCNLKYSEKKAFSPDDWVYAYKDETGMNPVNVMQQQDAQEFLQVLCERLESTFKANSAGLRAIAAAATAASEVGATGGTVSASALAGAPLIRLDSAAMHGDVLRQAFGGKLCNQMLRDPSRGINSSEATAAATSNASGSPNGAGIVPPGGGNIREQEDPFVCISLQVKGAKNLEHSLSLFVEGEQISEYQWDESGPRETITKRQCISDMSDTLIFHLKRFELNFDTFRREKVNDAFPFPHYLNMYPYTKEGLSTGGVTPPASSSSSSSTRPAAYYNYELCGVVVHTGTTDSGHYYSYIKDTGDFSSVSSPIPTTGTTSATATASVTSANSGSDSGNDGNESAVEKESSSSSSRSKEKKEYRWLEFNDSEVSEFPEARLDAECFGGITTTHEYTLSTNAWLASEVPNPKSAYMLVYRRVHPVATPVVPTAQSRAVFPSSPTLPVAVAVVAANGTTIPSRKRQQDQMDIESPTFANTSTTTVLQPEPVLQPVQQPVLQPVPVPETDVSLLITQIQSENVKHARTIRIFSPSHFRFLGSLIDQIAAEDKAFKALPADILLEAFSVTTRLYSRSAHLALFSSFCERLTQAIDCVLDAAYFERMAQSTSTVATAMCVHVEEDDEVAAIALSLGAPASEDPNYPNSSSGSTNDLPSAVPSDQSMSSITLHNTLADAIGPMLKGAEFESVLALLYAPEKDVRMSSAKLLLSVFKMLSDRDGSEAFLVDHPEVTEGLMVKLAQSRYAPSPTIGLLNTIGNDESNMKMNNNFEDIPDLVPIDNNTFLPNPQGRGRFAFGPSPHGVPENMSEDDQLAWAIKMSTMGDAAVQSLASMRPFGGGSSVTAETSSTRSNSSRGSIDSTAAVDGTGAALTSHSLEGDLFADSFLGNDDINIMNLNSDIVNPLGIAPTAATTSSAMNLGGDFDCGPIPMNVDMEMDNMDIDDIYNNNINDNNYVPRTGLVPPPLAYAPRLLVELTTDTRMQLIAENWRKSDAVTWLLLQICRMGSAQRHFLLRREVVLQLGDIFMGDQSPLSGVFYIIGTRKRAPSSYVAVGPPSFRGGPLPNVAKNIPDWSHLLETVSMLVCSTAVNEPLPPAGATFPSISNDTSVHRSPHAPYESSIKLDYGSQLCAQARSLYSTMLIQSRYSQPLIHLVLHECFESNKMADAVAEILFEALTISSVETTGHVFEVMEAYLQINDSLTKHRVLTLFGGQMGPLDMLSSIKDQPMKGRLVCVCIRSLMTLVERVPSVKEMLTTPHSKIKQWAPWMLKFAFQFMNKCIRESEASAAVMASYNTIVAPPASEQSADTNTAAAVASPLEKGPYIVVYGENDEERDLAWRMRAERTLQLLQSVLVSVGAQPDQLLPDDTFDQQSSTGTATGGTTATNSSSNNTGGTTAMDVDNLVKVHDLSEVATPRQVHAAPTASAPVPVPAPAADSFNFGLSDGMTDEDFAAFLQAQENFGQDVD